MVKYIDKGKKNLRYEKLKGENYTTDVNYRELLEL